MHSHVTQQLMEASQFGSPGAWGQLRADDKCGLFCRDSMISARVKKMRQSFENTELQQTPISQGWPKMNKIFKFGDFEASMTADLHHTFP